MSVVELQSEMARRLRTFASQAIEWQGGLVEWQDHQKQGLAVVDSQAAEVLGGEAMPLSLEPEPNCLWVNLAGDFLERTAKLIERQPRIATVRTPAG